MQSVCTDNFSGILSLYDLHYVHSLQVKDESPTETTFSGFSAYEMPRFVDALLTVKEKENARFSSSPSKTSCLEGWK